MSHLWIATHLPDSPTVHLLCEAARASSHTVDVVDVLNIHLDLSQMEQSSTTCLFGTASTITNVPETVITRVGASAPDSALDVIRAIEYARCRCVNTSNAIESASDKIRSAQLLANAEIPIPRTISLATNATLEEIESRLGPPPWILKLPRGVQGNGVARVDSMASLRSIVDVLRRYDRRLILQEFIAEAKGADVRVLVFGHEAVAAMRRQSEGDEFRSNLHRGGSAIPEYLTAEVSDLSVRASRALGLTIAGVDILLTDDGPVVIEVNAAPGLYGIQGTTTIDLATHYIECATAAPKVRE